MSSQRDGDDYVAIDLGPDPVIEYYKRDVDRTLIRENLKKTPEERLLQLQAMQAFVEELRKAKRQR